MMNSRPYTVDDLAYQVNLNTIAYGNIATLTANNTALRTELATLRAELAAAQRRTDLDKEMIFKVSADVTSLSNELDTAKLHAIYLESKLKIAEAKIVAGNKTLNDKVKALENNIKQQERNEASLLGAINFIKDVNGALTKQNAELAAEKTANYKRIAELEEETQNNKKRKVEANDIGSNVNDSNRLFANQKTNHDHITDEAVALAAFRVEKKF